MASALAIGVGVRSRFSRWSARSHMVAMVGSGLRRAALAVAASASASACAQHANSTPLVFSTCVEHHVRADGIDHCVLVSLPLSYQKAATSYPVLYVLHGEPLLFSLVATAARVGRYTATLAERTWYPDLIVVGVTREHADVQKTWRTEPPTLSAMKHAMAFVDGTYRTRPYADARALIGHGRSGDSVARALTDEAAADFGHFLIGSPIPAEGAGPVSIHSHLSPP